MHKFIVKRSRLDVQVEQIQQTVSTEVLATSEANGSNVAAATTKVCDHNVCDVRNTGAVRVSAQVNRPFIRDWLTKYPWLTYDEANDKAFCNTCQNAKKKRLLDSSSCNTPFLR